jgi:hypothetical protein
MHSGPQAWAFESLEATAEELQSEFALEFQRFFCRLRTVICCDEAKCVARPLP